MATARHESKHGEWSIRDAEPIAHGLLLFGIYTSERLKVQLGGISIRYSFIALLLLATFWLIKARSRLSEFAPYIRTLTAFGPYLFTSAISCLLSPEPSKSLSIWMYNLLTLMSCWVFSVRVPWPTIRRPWLGAMTAHGLIIAWDELCIGGVLPQGWAVGLLFPTYNTFRTAGFYVAPQFYSVAIGLSFLLYASMARTYLRLESALLMIIAGSTTISFSRSGVAMIMAAVLGATMITALRTRFSKTRETSLIANWSPPLCGALLGIAFVFLVAPEQSSEQNRLLGVQQTWARICPLFETTGLRNLSCPESEVGLPEGNPKLSSEGRRLAEWAQVREDLMRAPWFGLGYIGNLSQLTIKTEDSSSAGKWVQYRYESLWATILSYYGILGALALVGGLITLGSLAGWPPSFAGIIAFWLVGAHSSQTFARLDIWLPTMIYLRHILEARPKAKAATE